MKSGITQIREAFAALGKKVTDELAGRAEFAKQYSQRQKPRNQASSAEKGIAALKKMKPGGGSKATGSVRKMRQSTDDPGEDVREYAASLIQKERAPRDAPRKEKARKAREEDANVDIVVSVSPGKKKEESRGTGEQTDFHKIAGFGEDFRHHPPFKNDPNPPGKSSQENWYSKTGAKRSKSKKDLSAFFDPRGTGTGGRAKDPRGTGTGGRAKGELGAGKKQTTKQKKQDAKRAKLHEDLFSRSPKMTPSMWRARQKELRKKNPRAHL